MQFAPDVQTFPHSPQLNRSVDVSTQSSSQSVSSHSEPAPASPPIVLMLLPPHAIANRAKNASAMVLETHIPEVETYHAWAELKGAFRRTRREFNNW
jgi:hypothetical protein